MTGVGFPNSMGQDGGIYNEGFVIFTTVIVAMQYKVMLMTKSITWINWTVWWLSFLGYLFFVYVYGLVPTIADWYHVVNFSFGTVRPRDGDVSL